MESLHFDIETAAQYKDFETFILNDTRGSDLFRKKYNRMGNWSEKYQSVDEAYLEQGGIITTYGRIVCISFGFFHGEEKRIKSYYGEDERDIVNSFNEMLKKIEKKNFNIVGFRIFHFDIVYLLHKLHKYGIKPANIIYMYNKKPWDMRVIDMADDFKGRFAWSFSFDEVCYELGIESPKDKIDGSEVHGKFWNGEYDDIKEYCEKDVSASLDMDRKIYKHG